MGSKDNKDQYEEQRTADHTQELQIVQPELTSVPEAKTTRYAGYQGLRRGRRRVQRHQPHVQGQSVHGGVLRHQHRRPTSYAL